MNTIRILIADDHALVRAGISSLIGQIDNVQVVGEADNGRETLKLIKTLSPDIVLLDISMPEMNGLEAVRRISREHSDVRVIILSMHANEEYVLQGLTSGANGYLLKDADQLELEVAIKSVAKGHRYLSSGISKHVIQAYVRRTGALNSGKKGSSPFSAVYQLTSRQREILQLIAEGNSTKDIARKLKLSVKTAESHRTELMKRLDIHDVTGLVRYAIRIGLVQA